MRHSFDPDVAAKVGIPAAVLYQNIAYWCEKNAANERNVHDGRVWTYNSIKAFAILFPYLTEKQIRTALEKLESAGLVEVGNFNETAYDRTRWYAVKGAGICPDGRFHLPKKANGNAQKGKPIPDSKPDHKPDDKNGLFSADALPASSSQQTETTQKPEPASEVSADFERFWTAYPKDGRKSKKAARAKFERAAKEVAAEVLVAAAGRYARWLASGRPGEFRPQAKNAETWLNKGCWEDDLPGVSGGAHGEADDLEREADAEFRSGNHAQAAVLRMKAQVKRGLPPDVLKLRKELRALELTNTQHGVDLLKRAIEWAEARYGPN